MVFTPLPEMELPGRGCRVPSKGFLITSMRTLAGTLFSSAPDDEMGRLPSRVPCALGLC